MSTQENPRSKNVSKPHRDSGDLVLSVLLLAIFIVIIMAGAMAMSGVLEAKGENAAPSQICLMDVAKATEDMKDPQIEVLFEETLGDGTHNTLFSIDRSFNTDLDTKYLKCEVNGAGEVTELSSVTADEANVLVETFETAELDKENVTTSSEK